jgi:hypothetical protein
VRAARRGPAIKTLARLVEARGPALGKMKAGGDLKASGLAALAELLAKLDGAEVEAVLKVLAQGCKVQGSEDAKPLLLSGCFDQHFRGRLDLVLKWALFALKVNYGPLFEGLGVEGMAPGASAAAGR